MYEHSLDQKGRVVLPASFRASVAERGFLALRDDYIALWDEAEFLDISARWKAARQSGSLSEKAYRKFFASVVEVKPDAAGRISLPKKLLDKLEFESKVVLVGAFEKIEIWPEDKYVADQDGTDADGEVAAAIRELGL